MVMPARTSAADARWQPKPTRHPAYRTQMKRAIWPIVVFALALAVYLTRRSHVGREHGGDSANTIDYQGKRFKLSKAYSTWDDYKDDPDNLDTNEFERIERVMVEASFP